MSKYKINVMNMIKKHKENILVDNIYNYNYEDNINEEITKNIINKYIYIIEITKKIIYIIQKYIDNKTSTKINDIMANVLEFSHRFLNKGGNMVYKGLKSESTKRLEVNL